MADAAPLTLTSIGAGKYTVAKPITSTPGSNNNPFNIKVGTDTQAYITDGSASVGSTATDGGNFLKFKDRTAAVNAAQKLLFSSGVYKGLTVDAALKKWSNNGYGGNIIPDLATSSVDTLTPEQQTQVLNAMELKGENDAPAPGTLSLSQIGAGKYTVVGKGDQTPPATPDANGAPAAPTPPAWAPGGMDKPAQPNTQQPFSQNKVADDPSAAKGFLQKLGDFFTGAEQGLGKEAAAAIGAPEATANETQIADTQNKNVQIAIQKIKELKAQGIDTSSAEAHVQQILSNPDNGASASDVLPAVDDTPTQVAENAGGVALDVASFGTYGKISKTAQVAENAAPSVIEAAGKGVQTLAQRSERKAVTQIAQDVAPKLNAGQTASEIANKAGGTSRTGILRRTVLNASKATQDIASTIRKMVPDFKPGGALTDNIEKTKTAVYDSVEKLASQVEKDGKNIAIPFREITAKMDTAMKDPAVSIALQDTGYERRVTSLKDEALNIMKKNGGNPSGILRSTQEFDNLVRKVFPNLYDKEFSTARSAVKVIRDAMSNTVDEALPNTAYKATRQAQSRLFSAIENMSEKAASGPEKEIGSDIFSRFGENHPIVSKLGKLLGAGVGAGVGLGGVEEGLKKLGL